MEVIQRLLKHHFFSSRFIFLGCVLFQTQRSTLKSVLTHRKTTIPLQHRRAQQNHCNTTHSHASLQMGSSVTLCKITHHFFGQQVFPPANAMCWHRSVVPLIRRSKSCREDNIHINTTHSQIVNVSSFVYLLQRGAGKDDVTLKKKNRKQNKE